MQRARAESGLPNKQKAMNVGPVYTQGEMSRRMGPQQEALGRALHPETQGGSQISTIPFAREQSCTIRIMHAFEKRL